jgi:hypothetical protein
MKNRTHPSLVLAFTPFFVSRVLPHGAFVEIPRGEVRDGLSNVAKMQG